MVFNVFILLAGVLSSLLGVVFDNQATIVFGAILVCTPLIQKSIDELLCKKWLDAIPTCSAILALIIIFVLSLELDPILLYLAPNISVSWLIVYGAGVIQLSWILLIIPKSQVHDS